MLYYYGFIILVKYHNKVKCYFSHISHIFGIGWSRFQGSGQLLNLGRKFWIILAEFGAQTQFKIRVIVARRHAGANQAILPTRTDAMSLPGSGWDQQLHNLAN